MKLAIKTNEAGANTHGSEKFLKKRKKRKKKKNNDKLTRENK